MNIIWASWIREEEPKENVEKRMFTGKKEDVTNGAIGAVFEWFMGNMEGHEEYSITYPSAEYELVMRKKSQ